MLHRPNRRPQFFYTTAPLPCPYLSGRTERKVVTELSGPEGEALHDRLSRAGFRRSHNIAYAPVCPCCQSCIPIRIVVDDFAPGRTHRRVLKANSGLANAIQAAFKATVADGTYAQILAKYGIASGSAIRQKIVNRDAPASRAASSRSLGTPLNWSVQIHTTMGRLKVR